MTCPNSQASGKQRLDVSPGCLADWFLLVTPALSDFATSQVGGRDCGHLAVSVASLLAPPLLPAVHAHSHVEAPCASLSLLSRPRVGLGSFLIDVSSVICLTVTYEVESGWGRGRGHLSGWYWDPPLGLLYPHSLSALSCALGLHSKPTTSMTSKLRKPQEMHRGRSNSGKPQAKIRLMGV